MNAKNRHNVGSVSHPAACLRDKQQEIPWIFGVKHCFL
jgi:hypothetical protein